MRTPVLVLTLAVAAASGPAIAAKSHGSPALALAAFIGENAPTVSRGDKAVLFHFLGGRTNFALRPGTHRIVVQADKVRCRMGDVDLTLHSCELTFGTKTLIEGGRTGQALLATMLQNAVAPNGAAGTIYYSVAHIRCTINPVEIQTKDGGGAVCEFANTP